MTPVCDQVEESAFKAGANASQDSKGFPYTPSSLPRFLSASSFLPASHSPYYLLLRCTLLQAVGL